MGRGSSRSSSGGSRGSSRSSSSRGFSSGGSRGSSFSSRPVVHNTVIIGGSRHYYDDGYSSGGGAHANPAVFIAIFLMIFGIFPLIGGIGLFNTSMQYGMVDGVCLYNDNISGWYYTTYKYTVDGINYTQRSNEGWEIPEDKDKVVTLYYLKSDPSEITEEDMVNYGGAVGLILLAAAMETGALFLLVKNSKKKKNVAQTSSAETPAPSAPAKVTCPYCGRKLSSDATSCPSCGAKR